MDNPSIWLEALDAACYRASDGLTSRWVYQDMHFQAGNAIDRTVNVRLTSVSSEVAEQWVRICFERTEGSAIKVISDPQVGDYRIVFTPIQH